MNIKLCLERLAVMAPLSLLAVGGISNGAHAASNIGTGASPLGIPPQSPVIPFPDSGVPEGYFFNLRPIGKPLGDFLADHGIYLYGRTLQQGVGFTSGGLRTGTIYEGFNLFGVDLDMAKIAGIQGGSMHISVNDLAGSPFASHEGSSYVFNRAFAYADGARLQEFSWEQNFNHMVDVRVGRVPIGSEFDIEPVYCEFIYGMCGLPAGYAFTKGSPAYDTASWAGVLQAKLPWAHTYVHTGIYADQPDLALVHHWGWPGRDWSPDYIRGATIPVQIGYRTTFADDPYPKSYDIGGFYDTGDYSDPLANAAGQNRVLNGGTPRVDHGRSGIWLQATQTIFRPDMSNHRALTAFVGTNIVTSGSDDIANTVFAGLSYAGPFAGRPFDTANILVQSIGLSGAYQTFMDSELAVAHLPQNFNPRETYIELNYGIALAPGMVLKPNFEYVWNPDQVNIPHPSATLKHDTIIGVAFSAFLPETLGLPRLGGGV